MSGILAFVAAHRLFFHFIKRYFSYFLLLARSVFFTPLEFAWPARKVPYLQIIGRDLSAFVILLYAVYPLVRYLNKIVPGGHHFPVPATIAHSPLGVRVLLFFVLSDLGHYWIHRLTHTRYFWRVHKWHHDPNHMYWLAGIRSSIIDIAMISTTAIVVSPLLNPAPGWISLAVPLAFVLVTDWMHLNVPWGSKWVEWIIITPRYHHIHHSDNPEHFGRNLAPIFPVWDRLFGTYLDPDKVQTTLSFGTGEKTNPIRLILGV